MVVEFVKGQVQNFVAVQGFALNFEDRNIPSVKIREGDTVQYDGQVAIYINTDGDTIKGRCMGLKSAINMMGWLQLVEEEEAPEDSETPLGASEVSAVLDDASLFEEPRPPAPPVDPVVYKDPDYDPKTGGSFDAYAVKDENVHVVGTKGTEVIREEDLVVKDIPVIKSETKERERKKLEVAGDQVEVKMVTSSTVTPRATPKRKFEVVEGDQYGADSASPINMKKAASTTGQKSSYTVDDTTPRPTEGMSREAIQRITKPEVINADASQDAMVVKTIDRSKMDVKEVEGITLKKTESPKDVTFKKTKTPDGFTVKTKVGSGSTGISDVSQQGAVVVGAIGGVKKTASANAYEAQDAVEVAKIGEEKKAPPPPVTDAGLTGDDLINNLFEDDAVPDEAAIAKKAAADKKAKARADARKKASLETQKAVEAEKKATEPAPEEKAEPIKDDLDELLDEAVAGNESTGSDYLLMLPDEWGKMHWVKKEKFIKKITDIDFVKFILSVETTKAIQNACTERLKELEQTG